MLQFYCFSDSNGIIIEVGSTIDNTFPEGSVKCSSDAVNNPSAYMVSNKKVVKSSDYDNILRKKTVQNYLTKASQQLDSVADSWGYDSIASAISYLFSTNPQYKAEAETLNAWRDIFWAQAYSIVKGVLPETAEAFVAMLPAAPERPLI